MASNSFMQMNFFRLPWQNLLERLVALLLLALALPLLLSLGLFIGITASSPIVLTDSVVTAGGKPALRHRFRTTGPGDADFRRIGRFLRQSGMDELPALWNVVRGDIRLREVFPSLGR